MTELGDDRGVSEGASIAALVVLTVVVTASVGVGVLFIDSGEENRFNATFSFDHFPQRATLLVTYEGGEELRASNVRIAAPARDVTWAELRDLNGTATLGPGDRAQLNENNPYGARISGDERVVVVYVENENRTVLGAWNGTG
jgi:hypothetical protein